MMKHLLIVMVVLLGLSACDHGDEVFPTGVLIVELPAGEEEADYNPDISGCLYYDNESCDFCKYTPDWVLSVESWVRAAIDLPECNPGSMCREVYEDWKPTWNEVHEVAWYWFTHQVVCGY